jgi:hypothetical protein
MKNALDLWSWDGTVSRRAYLAAGLALTAFKYPIDYAVSALFGRPWHPLMYFSLRVSPILDSSAPHKYLLVLLAVALPFIAAGVSLSARRLRDMGVHPLWSGLFFLPFLHWAFILVLVVAPPAKRAEAPHGEPGPYREGRPEPRMPALPLLTRIIPASEGGAFLLGLLLSVSLGFACFMVTAQIDKTLGGGLFVGAPFGTGFVMAFCTSWGRDGTRGRPIAYGLVPTLVGLLILLAMAWEGLACILMATPIVGAMAALGAFVGHLSAGAGSAWTTSGAMGVAFAPALLVLELVRPPTPEPRAATASVHVAAPPEVVWRAIASMSPIDERPEPIFAIVAMPLEVRAAGSEPCAPRRWVFTNGAFEASVAALDEPRQLGFRIESEPEQLRRYLEVKGGRFELEPQPDGTTVVRGSVDYLLRVHPTEYWGLWTDTFLRAIERRVLAHVKAMAEHPERAPSGATGLDEMPPWMRASNETCRCTRHATPEAP